MPSGEPQQPPEGDDGPRPIRIAMIGTGRWAAALALEIAQTEGTELVSCFDTDPEVMKRFAVEFAVAPAQDLEAILSDENVDAGVACVPNAAHKDLTLALAEAGKHVFVPRPMSNYVESAKEMVLASREAEIELFVDHSSSFNGDLNAMHEAVESGRVGQVVAAHVLRSADWSRETSSWHLSPRECPGGPATLLGVSAAATLIRFLGRPVSVRGSLASGLTDSRVPDLATFLVEHEGGAHSTLVTSGVSSVPNDAISFYGTDGVLLYGPTVTHSGPRVALAEAGSTVVKEIGSAAEGLRGMEMFRDQVLNDPAPACTLELACTALATIEAGLMSVSESRRVAVSELLVV